MNRTIFILIVISLSKSIYSQINEPILNSEFIYGTWYDSSYSTPASDGFIFSPDSCCSFIANGETIDCIIEDQNLKVHYRVNYDSIPRQLDILLINLETDSIMGIIPMIFEIIDTNHIRLATYTTVSKNRPKNFDISDDKEITILTKYLEDIK